MLDKRKGKSSKEVFGEVLDNEGVQSIENENWRELVEAHTTNLRAKKVIEGNVLVDLFRPFVYYQADSGT